MNRPQSSPTPMDDACWMKGTGCCSHSPLRDHLPPPPALPHRPPGLRTLHIPPFTILIIFCYPAVARIVDSRPRERFVRGSGVARPMTVPGPSWSPVSHGRVAAFRQWPRRVVSELVSTRGVSIVTNKIKYKDDLLHHIPGGKA
ncbi:hypothetical protein J6590_054002 [Homalodisca vitripennis]|nr:hypothetical protein J6590_054002 [Homalodisca vitripennis]